MIPKDDTPDHHATIPSAWLDPGAASEGVGQIRSLFGCVTAIRANGATVQMQINDRLFQGDVIETGSDGRASIVFNDGTRFNLAARSRIALDEFSQQSDGSLNSARLSVSQGTFAIYAGLLGKAGNLSINTPFAIIRGAPGGAVLSLSVVAFMFVLIKELHADPRDLGFLLDDIVNYKDLEHGTFEIVTKEAVPRLIVVDNPEVTVVMEPTTTGFSVQLVTNSPAQMAELLSASDDAFAAYRMGQADPFTMGSSKAASGGGSFDGSIGGHLASVTQTPLTLQAGGAPPPVSDFTTMQTRLVQPFFHIPTAGIASAVVDDDGLTGGNATRHLGQGLFTGLLGGSLGLDGAGANGFSFAPGLNGATATVGLETVAYSLAGNVLTATVNAGARLGTALFTVQIIDLASGVYTVTLHENVLHAGGPSAAGADTVVTLAYIITDADGSSVSSSTLSITFNDDAPTATDHATQAVAEGSTVTGTLSFVAGADGAAVTHINGTALTFGVDGYSQQIDIGPGFLKVKADGSYSFAADAVTLSPVPVASATLTVTDGDNDTAAATIAFQVTDANMPTGPDGGGGGGTAAAAVDDDDLTGGNPADTTFTGVLGGSVGSDGRGGERLLVCRSQRNDRHGWHRDGDLQLGCRHTHADGDGAARCAVYS